MDQKDEEPSVFVKYKDDPAMPTRNLFERFYHERSLRDFFCELSAAGITDLEDIAQRTKKEVLVISPLNFYQRHVLSGYEKDGFIQFKPEMSA